MKKLTLPILLLAILALGAGTLIHSGQSQIRDLGNQYEAEISRRESLNIRRAEQDLAEHSKHMVDEDLISGKRARERHAEEWNRRCKYDAAFAKTTREKMILEISALSKDKFLPAEELLRRIATLAAPRKATIEITPQGNAFRVDVTFDMSVMTSGEEGSRTKHTTIDSLKREVIEIISRISKDMYDHCGQKGIDGIALACTHGVRQTQFGISVGGSTVTKVIYKCSFAGSDAKRVPDWHGIELHKVEDMFKVEHNEFPYLRIVTTTTHGFDW